MPVYRESNQTWMVKFPHMSDGEIQWNIEKGFTTREEAHQWERVSKPSKNGSIEMPLRDFVPAYLEDMAPYLKRKILAAKEDIINDKLLPYLGDTRLCDMTPTDVFEWLQGFTDESDRRIARKQLDEILNHAVRFYRLERNPARGVGGLRPKKQENEGKAQISEESQRFIESIADERIARCCLEVLSWSGIRVRDLMALTAGDINLKKKTISVARTSRGSDGGDFAAEPRAHKSKREIKVPGFLCDELREYIRTRPRMKRGDKLFPISLPQDAPAMT